MFDSYSPMRQDVAAIIKTWNAGSVTLTRSTRAAPEPETPYVPGDVTAVDVYTLDARVDGVAAEYVDGTTIRATDRMAIVSPKARLAGAVVDVVPRMSDTLSIDGAPVVVKKIEAVPASGPAARFHIFIAS